MLGFIMSIVMILFGEKLVITPRNQLVQQFPKIPLTTVAKIVIASILGINIIGMVIEIRKEMNHHADIKSVSITYQVTFAL